MKRFYSSVAIAPQRGHFAVTLDGRAVKTPAKHPFLVPGEPLAQAVAAEWGAQQDHVRPETMPLTRFVNTAHDRVADQRGDVVEAVAAYAGSDLLCYRAEAPAELAALQALEWDPYLDWATARFDARLTVTAGIVPVTQEEAALDRLKTAVAAFDPFALAALHTATTVTGSLVLALAAAHGHRPADDIWRAASLDETWQADRWGEDDEAAARRTALRGELDDAVRFLRLLDG